MHYYHCRRLVCQVSEILHRFLGGSLLALDTSNIESKEENRYFTLEKWESFKNIPKIFLFVDAIDECNVTEGVGTKVEEDRNAMGRPHNETPYQAGTPTSGETAIEID